MKKSVLFILAVAMLFACATSASAAPAPVMVEQEIGVFHDEVRQNTTVASMPDPGVEAEIDVGMGSGIEAYSSYVIVDDPISAGGSEWTQPTGYCGYRVWVENTSDETMKVTVTSAGGTFPREVPPNESKVILVVNNAAEGYVHTIDFKTASGVGSGTVRVRVSDIAF